MKIWIVWQKDGSHEYDDSMYGIFESEEEATKFADALNQKMIDWEQKIFKRITESWRYYVEEDVMETSAADAMEKYNKRFP